MGDMNRNISQNRIAILAVSQYVKNRNNIESWPKYRNTIESSHFCQFPPLVERREENSAAAAYSSILRLIRDDKQPVMEEERRDERRKGGMRGGGWVDRRTRGEGGNMVLDLGAATKSRWSTNSVI